MRTRVVLGMLLLCTGIAHTASALRVTNCSLPFGAGTDSLTSVTFSFDQDLESTSVTGLSVGLVPRSSVCGTCYDESVWITTGVLSTPNSRQIVWDLSGVCLAPNYYRIVVRGSVDRVCDRDARLMAMEETGALLPPPTVYRRIFDDLKAIRHLSPAMSGIRHFPRWLPGELIVQLTPEAAAQYTSGTYHGLDQLNATYGPVTVNPSVCFDLMPTLRLRFEEQYNPIPLGRMYSTAPGVVYAEANGLLGDGDDITTKPATAGNGYEFRTGWGDCPCGCIYEHFWHFVVNEGQATLVREYGEPLPPPLPPPLPQEGFQSTVVFGTDESLLDGEPGAGFPSGDGVEGGDFYVEVRYQLPASTQGWQLYE